ncbi:MAG: BrnA antitoxin family protein [Methylococcaceae bacterium]|nr:BrnA antitoxin family protein [Methylococcaceae bacterium]
MAKKLPSPLIDEDGEVRELQTEDFARARPAREVLPEILSVEIVEQLLKPRGRPRKTKTKVHLNLRLSPEVVEYFRTTGPGWQTRLDEALKEWVQAHPL